MANDSVKKIVIVAASLCLICSILVSTAVSLLRPTQAAAKLLDKQRNILEAAHLAPEGASAKEIGEIFKRVETRMIDLDSGEYVEGDIAKFDQRKSAKDPATSKELGDEDIAQIKRREARSLVYVIRDNQGGVEQVILPVRGYGLWSTMSGFLALKNDGNTVVGLTYYEHAETPGLGGEVDNPKWKAQWPGKKLFNEQGQVALDIVKGRVAAGDALAVHKVDGLAGATITSNGVENMFHYWLGQQGFGPFLKRLREGKV